MKKLADLVSAALISAMIFLSALPVLAVERNYVEDFTTTQYRDVPNTTAWWDTVAGELKLFPFVFTLVGACDTPGESYGITIAGDYAFVADINSGLQVIDISNPTDPTLVGTCDTPGAARGAAVSGDYAFVADGSAGLEVIDISDPTDPLLVGTCDTPGYAWAIAVSGDFAFIADYSNGWLRVVDISDPTNPVLAGSCYTPTWASGVAVSGDHAYVANGPNGLQVVDINDPTNPTLVGACETFGYAWAVTISGDHAFVASDVIGLQVIDVSDPTSPTLVGNYNTPGSAHGVTVSGDYAFVADGNLGFDVIDISDPTNPTLIGTYNTPGIAEGVAVSGNYAYMADGESGLQVIKISEHMSPLPIGSCPTPFFAYDIAVAGDAAYVANGPSGFLTMDISDPTDPSIIGGCSTDYALAIAVAGDYACVADYESGLKVIDISDPAAPTLLGAYDTPGSPYDIEISGDYAYLADGASGLLVVDISDPADPDSSGSYGSITAYGVAIAGDYVYVAGSYGGLIVLDISNPASPALEGSYYTGGCAYNVTLAGDHAFLADGTSGLQVIDVSDPAHPALAGTYNTPGIAYGVSVSGNRAYVADASSGLQVIDISNPTSPVLADSYDTPGESRNVVIDGDLAYVADGPPGIQVLQVYQRLVDTENNRGQSLVINSMHEDMVRARLSTSQSDSILWEISANGGTDWDELTPNGAWSVIAVPGTDLIWRSTHRCARYRTNPACTQLALEWLYDFAVIDSIIDIPDDQGGWVLMHFTRSGRDFADEATLPISNYGIWRRVESMALVAALETQTSQAVEQNAAADIPYLGDIPVITYHGKVYVQSGPGLATSSFPPGTWVWVATVPAVQQDVYIAAVPTVGDSSASGTNHTVLVLTAHTTTPSVWYVSSPDSGYSVDNIAPAVPTGFAVAYNTGSGNHLLWDPSPDEDFQYFNVYRSNDPDFVPSPSELVHSTTETSWSDPEYDGWDVHYKITAIDYVGNESDPASPGTVTEIAEPVVPQAYRLYTNVPNPFNPSTSIRYDVPTGGGTVTLRIYDVSGKLIRTLVDGPQEAGQKTAVWNGRDDRGRSVVSGVYFYRLQAPGYRKTLKMILVQ